MKNGGKNKSVAFIILFRVNNVYIFFIHFPEEIFINKYYSYS